MNGENRAAFFARLGPYFVPSTLLDIQLAYTLAKFSHRAQVRNELDEAGAQLRYFEHVRRVALVLIDEVKLIRDDLVISALLHDGIEDTRDLTPEMIEHCFGRGPAKIVKVLSKVPKEGYLERFMNCSDWRPYVIKACDRLDNLRHMADSTKEFRTKQCIETREKYLPLFDRMVELLPNELKQTGQRLKEAVLQELVRQECNVRP